MRNFEPFVQGATRARYRPSVVDLRVHEARPYPHPDATQAALWMSVVTCIVQHHAWLELRGADSARMARAADVLDHVFRGSHSAEARDTALAKLRALASLDGGPAESARDLAESFA